MAIHWLVKYKNSEYDFEYWRISCIEFIKDNTEIKFALVPNTVELISDEIRIDFPGEINQFEIVPYNINISESAVAQAYNYIKTLPTFNTEGV